MLTCKTCGVEFEPSHHNNTHYCSKKCSQKKNNSDYQKNNREKCREWGRKSYHKLKADPLALKKRLLRYSKERAKDKKLEHTITIEDINLPEYCPILGIKLEVGKRHHSYTIDRIEPTKGYTPDNIWVISQLANSMKWDSTREHRIAFAKWVLEGEGGYKLDR